MLLFPHIYRPSMIILSKLALHTAALMPSPKPQATLCWMWTFKMVLKWNITITLPSVFTDGSLIDDPNQWGRGAGYVIKSKDEVLVHSEIRTNGRKTKRRRKKEKTKRWNEKIVKRTKRKILKSQPELTSLNKEKNLTFPNLTQPNPTRPDPTQPNPTQPNQTKPNLT